jgi:predicted secreted protein
MQVSTAIAIYFLIWWVTLFAVLPFGVKSQHEGGDFAQGTDPGAPMMARIGSKLIWTTVVATTIFIVVVLIYRTGVVDIDAFVAWLRSPR